jgi:hypothetical protein
VENEKIMKIEIIKEILELKRGSFEGDKNKVSKNSQ